MWESLMLVTALAPEIGYDNATKAARTLRSAQDDLETRRLDGHKTGDTDEHR
jgi:fumarate hydratase class II